MRAYSFFRLLYTAALFSLLLVVAPARADEPASSEVAGMLPERVSDFQARGSLSKEGLPEAISSPDEFGVLSSATRVYVSPKGESFNVTLVKTRSDSAAYSLLTNRAWWGAPEQTTRLNDVGTAGIAWDGNVAFFKGTAFVHLRGNGKDPAQNETLIALARGLSENLDRGENEIPVLVKHMPEWEAAQDRALYAVSLYALQDAAGHRPVLDAVSFEGGAEAVTANYGASRLVIVENTTPQLATTNDARINAKLKELRDAGQPLPTAYRRVGNYSVFVFDAPDEATAAKLIDAVKYEQVVQWLGNNPYALRNAQRKYTETTANVILAVLKASGLSLLLCLGVGAVFGGIIFKRRRQQQAAAEAFSDAGGMLRLNLDEVTQTYDSAKLLGRGEQ